MELDDGNAVFEWDESKNRLNQYLYGISFEQARDAFADPNRLVFAGLDHITDEERLFCLGNAAGGLMTVRFTFLEQCIRICSAKCWRKGKGIYDAGERALN
jgi:uncharacterized DUF497 family protein